MAGLGRGILANKRISFSLIVGLLVCVTGIGLYLGLNYYQNLQQQTKDPAASAPPIEAAPAPVVDDGVPKAPQEILLPKLITRQAEPAPIEKDENGVTLPPMAVPVTGRVTLQPQGRVGAGAEVFLALIVDDKPVEIDSTRANEDGAFNLTADRPGTYVLLGQAAQHQSPAPADRKLRFQIEPPPKPKPVAADAKPADPAQGTPSGPLDQPAVGVTLGKTEPLGPVAAGDERILPIERDLALPALVDVTLVVTNPAEEPITDYRFRFKPTAPWRDVSNAEGACKLKLPEDTWRLEVDAAGFLLKSGVVITRADQNRILRVKPVPAFEVSGVVSATPPQATPPAFSTDPAAPQDDAKATPLNGVSVVCRTEQGVEFTTQTNRKGAFSFQRLPKESGLSLAFFKVGYQTHVIANLNHQTAQDQLAVTMNPSNLVTAAIAGSIFDETGTPMPGVDIMTQDASGRQKRTQSLISGSFRLESLSYQRNQRPIVIFAGSGYETITKTVTLDNDIAIMSVSMTPGRSLLGRVTDPKGAPLRNVTIQIRDADRLYETVSPDPTGDFLLDRLPRSPILKFQGKGYSSLPLEITADTVDDLLEITLFPLGRLNGRVATESGLPIQNFTVFVEPFDEAPDYNYPCAREDGGCQFEDFEGWFQINDLPKNTPYLLFVEAPGMAPRASYPHQSASGRMTPLTISVSPEGRVLRGRVVDLKGQARPDVDVNLIGYPLKNNWNRVSTWKAFDSGQLKEDAFFFKTTRTDESGAYVFTDLTAGHDLQLMVLGSDAARTHRTGIHTLITGQENLFDLTVFDAARITGRVNRKKYPDATTIRLFHQETRFSLERTLSAAAETAQFSFDGLPPGAYQLTLQNQEARFHEASVRVVEGREQQIDIGFGGIFQIQGTLLFDGETTAGKVYLGNGRDWLRADTDVLGQFQFNEVGAGTYSVVAFANQGPDPSPELLGRYPNRQQLQVHDRNLTRRFHFQRFGAVHGRLPQGNSAGRVYLAGAQTWSVETQPDGAFKFVEIPPGRYHLQTQNSSSNPNILIPDLEVTAGAAGLNLGDIIAEPVGSLRLIMGGDISTPDFQYRIRLTRAGAEKPFRIVTTPPGFAGPFLIENLPTGPLTLTVNGAEPGYNLDPNTVETEVFQTAAVDVLMQTQAVTLLQLSIIGNGTPNQIILTSDDQEIRLRRGIPARSFEYSAILTNSGKAFIEGVTPGVWDISVQSSGGDVSQTRAVLLPGKPVFQLLYLDR